MKVEYINPFIESVFELFSTMLGCEAKRGEVGFVKNGIGDQEFTALIGLSGPARGSVALSFPANTALAMSGRLLGIELTEMDETIPDALGELVNIVAGGAKAKLHEGNGKPIDLSLPNVIRGSDYAIDSPSDADWLDIPFQSELGTFNLRVTFEVNSKGD